MAQTGRKLKKLRELRNYTQGYMAEKLGMSQSNYGRIENGSVALDPERLEEIAGILETSVESIMGFDETYVFNIHNPSNSANGIIRNGNGVHHSYQISPEIKKLYEDKISLIEELYQSKILLLEERIRFLEKGKAE